MKKVIFISALAIAAAVSCTKSDIVDTKFNEQIGFQTYVGRDAQTKASVETATTLQQTGFGVYGFYTGSGTYNQASTETNLWANDHVSYSAGEWVPATTKYWTNDKDQYTFLAYAPYGNGNITNYPTELGQPNPTIKFTVPEALGSQTDLLYSNNLTNTTKANAELNFKHALSRITVKASEANAEYDYTVTAISLKGKFIANDVLTLATGAWSTDGKVAETDVTYNIATTSVVVPDTRIAGNVAHDFAGADKNNYLMVIPVNLTADAEEKTVGEEKVTIYPYEATLSVTYTTTFDEHVSTPMTKTLPIAIDFQKGKAYSINLVFAPNQDNKITFTVKVDSWDDVEPDTDGTDFDDEDEETPVDGGNPENGTEVPQTPQE